MILSASRRTDIPARYAPWMMNRLRAGFALVRSPYDAGRLSRVPLSPRTVDCIVFWTKDPAPMLGSLSELEQMGYSFYFQFTLTPYGRALEPGLPAVPQRVDAFRRLSRQLGPGRVVWRYDPVLFCGGIDLRYHLTRFEALCRQLQGYTGRCVFSFLDWYPKIKKRMEPLSPRAIEREEMEMLAEGFSKLARQAGIELATCCEEIDLSRCKIGHGACIDRALIEKITGRACDLKKDTNQRGGCGCCESVDIGMYDSCPNGCLYCYANAGKLAGRNALLHDPDSPLLIGQVRGDERITERAVRSNLSEQTSLF